MGILDKIAARRQGKAASWSQPLSWELDALRLPFLGSSPLSPDKEQIEYDFEGYVRGAAKSNGVVFALIAARMMVFAEARFQWRRWEKGRPGDLFGDGELSLLERPWRGGTTGELLARMEMDVSLAGNSWWTVADDNGRLGKAATGPGRRMTRMRPDWVTMAIASHSDDPDLPAGEPYALDSQVIGVFYEPKPRGTPSGKAVFLRSEEIVHYSPIPDPEAQFRGMSWLTPVIREVEADKAATLHTRKLFTNGATHGTVVTLDKSIGPEQFKKFKDLYNAEHRGAENAYKTLFLGGGADVKSVGVNFQQLEMAATRGKGESRLAAAAGVPPSWVGFSEGLQGSALNAGNFTTARRRYADGTIRPLWRIAAASLENILRRPSDNTSLWYDDRDIAFLREDAKDNAEILRTTIAGIRQATDSGWDPDAAARYFQTGDINQLIGNHTGLFSVQLQPPGADQSVTVSDMSKAAELIAAGWKAVPAPAPKELTT